MTREILGLSQKINIDMVLDRYDMKNCSREDKLNLLQCFKNDLQKEQMKKISYASVVASLMYAQVFIRPDIET